MNDMNPETWLFDLGNSRIKGARLAAGAPAEVFGVDWAQPGFAAALTAQLRAWPAPARVLVAAVAGEARTAIFSAALPDGIAARTEWLHSPREACGVRNVYAIPERLGIDRFLALVALREARGTGVIVGCGTALTLDALSVDGSHAEGMIAPAPTQMLASLRGATAIAGNNPDAFAEAATDDTARALQAGCWAAAGALVGWFHARHGEATPLLLHGGWAPALAAWLARDGRSAAILEHAVLCGLAIWAARAHVE